MIKTIYSRKNLRNTMTPIDKLENEIKILEGQLSLIDKMISQSGINNVFVQQRKDIQDELDDKKRQLLAIQPLLTAAVSLYENNHSV